MLLLSSVSVLAMLRFVLNRCPEKVAKVCWSLVHGHLSSSQSRITIVCVSVVCGSQPRDIDAPEALTWPVSPNRHFSQRGQCRDWVCPCGSYYDFRLHFSTLRKQSYSSQVLEFVRPAQRPHSKAQESKRERERRGNLFWLDSQSDVFRVSLGFVLQWLM